MFSGFCKKKPPPKHNSKQTRQLSSASFGGMQVRELQARLEIFLDEVLKRHISVLEPAKALAQFNLIEQERFLNSVDRISLINAQFALKFCNQAIPALAKMDDTIWEAWVDNLLETLSKKGIDASTSSISEFHAYQQAQTPDSGSVPLSEVSRILEIFLQALNGRSMKLATSTLPYTDTETLYLPESINHFKSRDDNFRLYKALLVHQWAQTWFGTWRINIHEMLKTFADLDRALRLFHWLETQRLDACLQREFPGLSREMKMFRNDSSETNSTWCNAVTQLQLTNADVHTSLECLSQLYPLLQEPEASLYQGQLRPQETAGVISRRNQREQSELHHELFELRESMQNQTTQDPSSGFSISPPAENGPHQVEQTQLQFNGDAIDISPQLQSLLDSITQDHNEIPQHYLDQVNADENHTELESTEPSVSNDDLSYDPNDDPGDNSKAEPASHDFSYHEWDHSRQRYRKNWCLLHEQSVIPVGGVFVNNTLNKYHILLKKLRRSFEALRQLDRRMKREPYGEDIDIDAAVESWADTHNGLEASERLFIQTRRKDRNVAVMFMVDMSASTAGWINQVERESLVLLCEALELLGDRYAIYGFSGRGNKNCQAFHIKNFDESYNDEVRGRIEGIQPQEYTRLGAAIRHLGTRLSQVDAPTRLLITLSDGRPDDIDGYRGQYGIQDTRKALIEICHLGIYPYCITIDTNAREYLPHMFGKNGFTIINQVEKLPLRIADIYRGLTN